MVPEKKARQRHIYRTATTVTIIVASSLPFTNSQAFGGTDFVGSLAGVVVAVLTALNTTLRWDHVWRTFTYAQAELETALTKWELDADELDLSLPEGVAEARNKTVQLAEVARRVREREADQYFAAISSNAALSRL